MFRVVSQLIIRSTHNCIYSIWYLSNRYCYLPLSWTSWNCSSISSTIWQVTDAVDKVVCAPDDGWRYHPKHVEQFTDINKLCNVASFWIFIGIYLRWTDPWTLNIKRYMTKSILEYFHTSNGHSQMTRIWFLAASASFSLIPNQDHW